MENKTFPHFVTIKYSHVSSGGLELLSSVHKITKCDLWVKLTVFFDINFNFNKYVNVNGAFKKFSIFKVCTKAR